MITNFVLRLDNQLTDSTWYECAIDSFRNVSVPMEIIVLPQVVLRVFISSKMPKTVHVGDIMEVPARNRAGLVIVETSTIAGEVATSRVTLFVLPNPIQVNSVDKAIGRTVEFYFIRFNRRLFGK